MNQSNLSSAIREHISEIFYLLNFFSQTQVEQWDRVPSDFSPAWVEIGDIQCNADSSIFFLTLMLSGRVYLNFLEPHIHIFNENMKSILYEIGGLLDDWIINTYYDFIFLKRTEDEIMNPDRIWLILSRLCKIALGYEDWGKYQIDELSFDYFVKNYTHSYDPI
ncbi:hypothetical protein [Synechocystis sp. PCC 7509]|uniref:hypothetical protein n=1 Tax=Synechocystis sp. PCC 7509 TaxID=927677 RepID=UPI0002ABA549|nr:hypothetical protein [Synechocystis sp. PCC 7509]